MRRRSRRTANNSESTGKIGQELPSNQPRPLVPLYPDEALPGESRAARPPAAAPESRAPRPQAVPSEVRAQRPPVAPAELRAPRQQAQARRQERPARPEGDESAEAGRLEMETQPDMPSAPSAEAQAIERSPQAPKGYVVLAIGLPGSGKTTWFRRRGVTPLSSDLLRSILFDDVEEQKFQGLVFSTLRSLLLARLKAHMPWNYVDATNLSPHERRQWIRMSKSFGYEVQAVFFDVPLEVCLQRNRHRERSVSDEVMQKMAERLRPPNFQEGFSK